MKRAGSHKVHMSNKWEMATQFWQFWGGILAEGSHAGMECGPSILRSAFLRRNQEFRSFLMLAKILNNMLTKQSMHSELHAM